MRKRLLSLFLVLSMIASLVVVPNVMAAVPEADNLKNFKVDDGDAPGNIKISFTIQGATTYYIGVYEDQYLRNLYLIEDKEDGSGGVDTSTLAATIATAQAYTNYTNVYHTTKTVGDGDSVTINDFNLAEGDYNKTYYIVCASNRTLADSTIYSFTVGADGKLAKKQSYLTLNANTGKFAGNVDTVDINIDAGDDLEQSALLATITNVPTLANYKLIGWSETAITPDTTENKEYTTKVTLPENAADSRKTLYAVWGIKPAWTADDFTVKNTTYNGNKQTAAITATGNPTISNAKYGDDNATDGKKDAGTYDITFDAAETTAKRSTTGIVKSWTINKATFKAGFVTANTTYGEANNSGATPTDNGITADDYAITYIKGDTDLGATAPTDAGTYKVKLTLTAAGQKNFVISNSNPTLIEATSGEYTISAKQINIAGQNFTKTYDGTAAVKKADGSAVTLSDIVLAAADKVGSDDVTLVEDGTFAIAYTDVNAGTGDKTVTVSGVKLGGAAAANYTLVDASKTISTTSTIDKKAITATIAADKNSKTYGEAKTFAIGDFTYDTLATPDTDAATALAGLTFASDGAAATANANTEGYAITVATQPTKNYTVSVAADSKLVVNKADLTAPTTVKGMVSIGDSINGATIALKDIEGKNGEKVSGTATVTYADTDKKAVAGEPNYTGLNWTFTPDTASEEIYKNYNTLTGDNGELEVNAKTIVTGVLEVSDKTYDGNAVSPTTATVGDWAEGTDFTVKYKAKDATDYLTEAPKAVGEYTAEIVLSDDKAASNTFASPVTASFKINPVVLTVEYDGTITKTEDGTNTADVDVAKIKLSGKVGTEDVNLAVKAGETFAATYDTAAVGDNKTVTVDVSKLELTGADKDNYKLPDSITFTGSITAESVPTNTPEPTATPVTKYAVTAKASTNGTYKVVIGDTEYDPMATPAPVIEAEAGTEVKVNTTPAKGYVTDKVTVTKADGTEVEVNNRAFTMPAEPVTITVTFKRSGSSSSSGNSGLSTGNQPTNTPAPTATAAPTATPLPEGVEEHKHYVIGYEDGSFRSENGITRAETAAIFARALSDYVEGTPVSGSYDDVASSAWYANYVNYLSSVGVITGYEDGTFRPDNNITRREFTAMISRLGEVLTAGSMSFSDVDAADWAIDYIYTAYTNGWVQGYEDGTFRPSNSITRAEAVTIVNHYLGRGVDAEGLSGVDYTRFPDVSTSHWAYYDIIEAANDHTFAEGTMPEDWVE